MPWITNYKHKIEEKSTKSSQSSSKVVGLGPADLWEFPTLAMIRHPARRLGERCLTRVTRACTIPSVVGSVNTGAVAIHGKYRSSVVNKSIVISIIDRNVYRWVTAKRWFSQHDQKRRPIRSAASDCLRFTNGRTKCDTKTAQINKKNRFYD